MPLFSFLTAGAAATASLYNKLFATPSGSSSSSLVPPTTTKTQELVQLLSEISQRVCLCSNAQKDFVFTDAKQEELIKTLDQLAVAAQSPTTIQHLQSAQAVNSINMLFYSDFYQKEYLMKDETKKKLVSLLAVIFDDPTSRASYSHLEYIQQGLLLTLPLFVEENPTLVRKLLSQMTFPNRFPGRTDVIACVSASVSILVGFLLKEVEKAAKSDDNKCIIASSPSALKSLFDTIVNMRSLPGFHNALEPHLDRVCSLLCNTFELASTTTNQQQQQQEETLNSWTNLCRAVLVGNLNAQRHFLNSEESINLILNQLGQESNDVESINERDLTSSKITAITTPVEILLSAPLLKDEAINVFATEKFSTVLISALQRWCTTPKSVSVVASLINKLCKTERGRHLFLSPVFLQAVLAAFENLDKVSTDTCKDDTSQEQNQNRKEGDGEQHEEQEKKEEKEEDDDEDDDEEEEEDEQQEEEEEVFFPETLFSCIFNLCEENQPGKHLFATPRVRDFIIKYLPLSKKDRLHSILLSSIIHQFCNSPKEQQQYAQLFATSEFCAALQESLSLESGKSLPNKELMLLGPSIASIIIIAAETQQEDVELVKQFTSATILDLLISTLLLVSNYNDNNNPSASSSASLLPLLQAISILAGSNRKVFSEINNPKRLRDALIKALESDLTDGPSSSSSPSAQQLLIKGIVNHICAVGDGEGDANGGEEIRKFFMTLPQFANL